jgi:hypothetical protein
MKWGTLQAAAFRKKTRVLSCTNSFLSLFIEAFSTSFVNIEGERLMNSGENFKEAVLGLYNLGYSRRWL